MKYEQPIYKLWLKKKRIPLVFFWLLDKKESRCVQSQNGRCQGLRTSHFEAVMATWTSSGRNPTPVKTQTILHHIVTAQVLRIQPIFTTHMAWRISSFQHTSIATQKKVDTKKNWCFDLDAKKSTENRRISVFLHGHAQLFMNGTMNGT